MNIDHIKTRVRYLNEYYPNLRAKEILKSLKIVTSFLDTSTGEELPDGCYFKYAKIRYVLIHPDIPCDKRHVVYAHELGHSIFHPNINTLHLELYDQVFVDKIELEADTFASEFLIPFSILIEFHNQSVYTIAEYLNIPVKLVELRYNNLDKNELIELERLNGLYYF